MFGNVAAQEENHRQRQRHNVCISSGSNKSPWLSLPFILLQLERTYKC
jgi:hypothetical protein